MAEAEQIGNMANMAFGVSRCNNLGFLSTEWAFHHNVNYQVKRVFRRFGESTRLFSER